MGGRPRDDEVKEEPDEDEAAMLCYAEAEQGAAGRRSESPETTIRGLGCRWRSYHDTGRTRRRSWRHDTAYGAVTGWVWTSLRDRCRHAPAAEGGEGESRLLRAVDWGGGERRGEDFGIEELEAKRMDLKHVAVSRLHNALPPTAATAIVPTRC